jgi:hypothetical protein
MASDFLIVTNQLQAMTLMRSEDKHAVSGSKSAAIGDAGGCELCDKTAEKCYSKRSTSELDLQNKP